MARSRSPAASGRSSPFPSFRAKARGARPRRGSRRRKALPRRSASRSSPRRPFRVRTVRPATLLGKGQVEEIAELAKDEDARPADRRCGADPGPAEEPGGRGRHQGHRPHRADPGDLRRARGDRRRAAAGRACASRLSGGPPGAELDPPRAPARRLRLPRRPRRNADRGRPADDPRPHGQDPARARPGEAHAGAAP